MKVKFWGVRGSIPTPLTTEDYLNKLRRVLRRAHGVDLSTPEKVEAFIASLPREDRAVVGGNTTCAEVWDDETRIIIDAGSGLRLLGQKLLQEGFAQSPQPLHLLFTHHHHDHTNGFPFFVPAYLPTEIHFYGLHERLEERMVGLQVREYFPVPFHVMACKKVFHHLELGDKLQLGEFTITTTLLNHPGDAYGYRFEWRDRVFVFASDAEYKNPSEKEYERYLRFFSNADLLYFDGQYTLLEAFIKEDWGHSSALVGVDFAARANVKLLLVGHHDPTYSDQTIIELQEQAREYCAFMYPDSRLRIEAAFEGDAFDLSGPEPVRIEG
ncbi:MAG: hydrolase [Candidatus Poribacteria bacterium]|nr:MAG: hydrolase [Candidatus Poribacteria bacterium]